jgi:hypothetical protein
MGLLPCLSALLSFFLGWLAGWLVQVATPDDAGIMAMRHEEAGIELSLMRDGWVNVKRLTSRSSGSGFAGDQNQFNNQFSINNHGVSSLCALMSRESLRHICA